MKYRIKTIEKNNGEKAFAVEEGESPNFFWCLLFLLPVIVFWKAAYKMITIKPTVIDTFSTLQSAKAFIDHLIIKQKLADAIEHEQKIKSVTYQKYP